MNKILFFLIALNLNLCFGQKNTCNLNKISTYMKSYNSNFEKLDTSVLTQLSSLFEKNKEALPKQLTFPFKEKNLSIQNTGNMYYRYEERDKADAISLEISIDLRNSIVRTREKIDNVFYLNKDYYLNGNIRSKVINSWLGFTINKGYRYDSEGNIIETIDHDKGYEFNYVKVLEFCRENNINILEKRELSFPNKIANVTLENGRKVWNIEYFNQETNKLDRYQLDGHTGEIILKELGKELPRFIHDITKPKK